MITLAESTILISAGPTHEAIDPVRYLGNRSSGKMGVALAAAALALGARVILILGPVSLAPPPGCTVIPVISAEEMYQAVKKYISEVDLFISAAAVADYKAFEMSPQKIKKSDDTLTLKLVKNVDILKSLSEIPHHARLVGFAAETENLLENAEKKLREKHLDAIIANPVGFDQGFEAEEQSAVLIFKNGEQIQFDQQSKKSLAMKILQSLKKL